MVSNSQNRRLDRRREAAASWAVMVGMIGIATVASRLTAQTAAPTVTRPPTAVQASDPMRSATMRGDARLHDVCFLDERIGWACGDRGTVWHTDDGGENWTLQNTPTADSLYSICFVDEYHGWAAGGHIDPHTWTTSGLLLSTHDGGRTWVETRGLLLPLLKQIRFADARHGWAVGHTNELFPTGVFATDDGGRSWRGLPAKRAPGWVAADLLSPERGAMLGQDGSAWILGGMRAEPSTTPQFGLRSPMRVALNRTGSGWMVGQGGLVMQTLDAGRQWLAPASPLPPGASEHFDFIALAAATPGRAWIAGSPGTRVFRTTDFGESWQACATGQAAPLRAIAFPSERHGWAVGDFGTILSTSDGGATWKVQRQGANRAAILCLVAEADDTPIEMVAYLSGNEGYMSIVHAIGRRDLEAPPRTGAYPVDRLHEAVVRSGGCGGEQAWRFPLRQRGLGMSEAKIVDGWNTANDGRATQHLEAELVRAIRTWRPSTVVTTAPVSKRTEQEALARLTGKAALEAVRLAADPMTYPEQITHAGLEPWRVERVHVATPPGAAAELHLDTSELAIRLGRSIGDAAAEPAALIRDRAGPQPRLVGFKTLIGRTPVIPSRPDLLAGLHIRSGDGARRQLLAPPIRGLEKLKQAAAQRRNLRMIFQRGTHDPQQGLAIMGQISRLIAGLDDDSAARVLFELAQHYQANGSWDLAATAMESLAQDHGRHPLAVPATIWLIQYYGSREAAWRGHWKNTSAVRSASEVEPDHEETEALGSGSITWHAAGPVQLASSTTSAAAGARAMRDDEAIAESFGPMTLAPRAEKASIWAKNLKNLAPEMAADPRVGFPLAVAQRERGYLNDATEFFMKRRFASTDDAWSRCAEGELWLIERPDPAVQKCPRPLALCSWTTDKPFLDGRLEDEFWRAASRLDLASPLADDQQWPAFVLITRDDRHLYLAVHCNVAPDGSYPEGDGPRPRDPELVSRDRVEVLLDVDRDYATFYHLTVDHRGWVAEQCWGDATWNPQWYIAAARDERSWTAEIAIPLRELTDQSPRTDDCWAIGLQRTVPDVGFQSWNTPARQQIQPEGFGLLLFE